MDPEHALETISGGGEDNGITFWVKDDRLCSLVEAVAQTLHDRFRGGDVG